MPYLPHEKGHVNTEHLVVQIQRGQSLRRKRKYSPMKAAQRRAKGLGRKSAEAGRPTAGRNNPIREVSNISQTAPI
jgi:hypothetical protein